MPFKHAAMHRELGYICHTKRTLSNAAKAFIQLLNDKQQEDKNIKWALDRYRPACFEPDAVNNDPSVLVQALPQL